MQAKHTTVIMEGSSKNNDMFIEGFSCGWLQWEENSVVHFLYISANLLMLNTSYVKLYNQFSCTEVLPV